MAQIGMNETARYKPVPFVASPHPVRPKGKVVNHFVVAKSKERNNSSGPNQEISNTHRISEKLAMRSYNYR
jgi:hypothetical protein